MQRLFGQHSTLGLRTLVALLLMIALLVVGHHTPWQRTRRVLHAINVPIIWLASAPSNFVYTVKTHAHFRQHLIDENAQLHQQLILLNAQVQELHAIASDNKALRALLQSSSRVAGQILMAKLVAIDLAPFTHQIIVNQGEKAGVYAGQPVLGAQGVIGQVIATTSDTARVLLIADPKSAVPVTDTRNKLRAIAIGTGNMQQLKLLHVPKTNDMQVGDRLVTSGLGNVYPAGYPVGKITEIQKNPDESFATITLTPLAALDRGRHVLLAWPPKQMSDHG